MFAMFEKLPTLFSRLSVHVARPRYKILSAEEITKLLLLLFRPVDDWRKMLNQIKWCEAFFIKNSLIF